MNVGIDESDRDDIESRVEEDKASDLEYNAN